MNADPPAGFAGGRVAILEARLGSQVEALVRRLGGEPVWAPALREERVAAGPAVAEVLDRLAAGASPFVVLQTGAGVDALFDEAARLGREPELLAALNRATTVGRGPKPTAALAKRGLRPSFGVASPYTTHELLLALEALPLSGAGLTLLHYGERNEALSRALVERGAQVFDLLLYEWQLPADTQPLERFIDELLAGSVDVVAFTSQVQIRHLFAVAGDARRPALVAALRSTLVGAIGPTCATAAAEFDVPADVVPENPKLVPFFTALVAALAERRARDGAR